MDKALRMIFSLPAAVCVGLGLVTVVTFSILHENTELSYQTHLWAKEYVSDSIGPEDVYRQVLDIPEGLAGGIFKLGILFGCSDGGCSGGLSVKLTQGDRVQEHLVQSFKPGFSGRKRFEFHGYAAGPATLEISGLIGNSDSAPGLLFIREGKGPSLEGPGLDGLAYASVDWFKVFPGEEKLTSVFPSKLISLCWLISFAGLVALAWGAMKSAFGELRKAD